MTEPEIINDERIPKECLGISGAVNYRKPDEIQIKCSANLEKAINELNIFETHDQIVKRREALIDLQEFCNNWIYKKATENVMPKHYSKTLKCKLFTFGSYRLGVNFAGADIDALLIVPRFVTREEFFSDFYEELSNSEKASDLQAVPTAFVPVIKMNYMGVEIDLLFAKVDTMTIAEDFSLSKDTESLMRNMDEKDVRSVNGVRVTDDILRLVYNKETFRSVLKIIRLWAKRRGLYSNALGYLGGVSWAILVARVCQLWPLGSVSSIVLNFFRFFGQKWKWPSPVMLKPMDDLQIIQIPQWDPRTNSSDQMQPMPIITPSYPCQNSTYNMTESHKCFVIDQMNSAYSLLDEILNNKRPYKDLFKPLFFFVFKRYLMITYRSGQECSNQIYKEQTSFIESKLRFLVKELEYNNHIRRAVLSVKSYELFEDRVIDKNSSSHDDNSEETKEPSKELVRRWFVGLDVGKMEQNISVVDEVSKFNQYVSYVDVTYQNRINIYQYLPEKDAEEIRMKVKSKIRKMKRAASEAAATEKSTTDANGDTASPKVSRRSCDEVENQSNPILFHNNDTQPPESLSSVTQSDPSSGATQLYSTSQSNSLNNTTPQSESTS